ncbi:hypothetical protein DB347_17530 [Opitutaceae bacterium EW11]|nr:hypothetical protein DB347_17530 [Opitutaceae bacterium EW11]
MISGFLRTKIGFVLLVLLVVGVFAALSTLKKRRAAHAPGAASVTTVAGQSGAEDAAMLKRAQESSRARAEDVRTEQEVRRNVTSTSDQYGTLYRRRAVTSPVEGQYVPPDRARTEDGATDAGSVQPSLRIHGRKSASDDARGPVARAVGSIMPNLPGLQNLPKNPFESPFPVEGISGAKSRRHRVPPERFVPFGRLIKAELVMTLESSSEAMPLVGLITEPVYNNGRLVIPAGTEIHSTARPNSMRDRIVSGEEWHMVFPREGAKPNGRQLQFSAVALDREDQEANGLAWPVTDGSYGLRGRVLRNGQTQEEIMVFAAEALKAASATMMERETTVAGTRLQANATNAALAGGQAVLARVAERLMREIEMNGAYVQVPAGKQFYLYPKQVIDPDSADIPTREVVEQ